MAGESRSGVQVWRSREGDLLWSGQDQSYGCHHGLSWTGHGQKVTIIMSRALGTYCSRLSLPCLEMKIMFNSSPWNNRQQSYRLRIEGASCVKCMRLMCLYSVLIVSYACFCNCMRAVCWWEVRQNIVPDTHLFPLLLFPMHTVSRPTSTVLWLPSLEKLLLVSNSLHVSNTNAATYTKSWCKTCSILHLLGANVCQRQSLLLIKPSWYFLRLRASGLRYLVHYTVKLGSKTTESLWGKLRKIFDPSLIEICS